MAGWATCVLAPGCAQPFNPGTGGGPSTTGDMAQMPAPPDLAFPVDDLAQPSGDLASSHDLATPTHDLAMPIDLAVTPPDLAKPVDLATPPDMTTPVVPANAGDVCAGAPVLPIGVNVSMQDTTPLKDDYDFGNNVSNACFNAFFLLNYPGRDGAYQVSIPPGKTLSVTLTLSGSWDGALGIVTDCSQAGPSCVAGSDGTTSTEQASYKNSGSSSQTVYILVDAYETTQYGKFTIRADLM